MLVHIVLASLCVGLISARVICPDGSMCPDKNTCCLTNEGYGCCSNPSELDTALLKISVPASDKSNIQEKLSNVSVVWCSSTTYCYDGETCCRSPYGWGCCPFSRGVCCNGGLTCCPYGSFCASGGCYSRADIPKLPDLNSEKEPKTAVMKIIVPASVSSDIQEKSSDVSVVWCSSTTYCYDGETCCRSPYGWGCCPFSRGVCCNGGLSCCPYGSFCASGGCYSRADTPKLPDLNSEKEPETAVMKIAVPASVSSDIQEKSSDVSVVWCSSTTYCYDGQTCCRSPYGWRCCSYPRGVCCSGGLTCCPYGYYCTSSGCYRRADTPKLPDLTSEKEPETAVMKIAVPASVSSDIQEKSSDVSVVWCSSTTYCYDGQTCCRSPYGWRCCPYPYAQCCSSGLTCCPNGYYCTSSGCYPRADTPKLPDLTSEKV